MRLVVLYLVALVLVVWAISFAFPGCSIPPNGCWDGANQSQDCR